jgi:hypothetical protein
MNKAIALVFLAILTLTAACSREPKFHYGFPAIHPKLLIEDDKGKHVSGGRVVVTTNYWYPSLLGTQKGKEFIDEFPISPDGTTTLTLRQHHQITKQQLVIEAHDADPVTTRIDDDLNWASFETHPRKISVMKKPHLTSPVRTYWRGKNIYENRVYTVPLTGTPVGFSFKTGEFTKFDVDLIFTIERPASTDSAKIDKPVKITIKPTKGSIQKMSQHEVYFSLDGNLSTWGDTDNIQLEAKNSRSLPAMKGALAYTSSDGLTRALVSFWAHPVSEKLNDEPVMTVSLWAKIDHYE